MWVLPTLPLLIRLLDFQNKNVGILILHTFFRASVPWLLQISCRNKCMWGSNLLEGIEKPFGTLNFQSIWKVESVISDLERKKVKKSEKTYLKSQISFIFIYNYNKQINLSVL